MLNVGSGKRLVFGRAVHTSGILCAGLAGRGAFIERIGRLRPCAGRQCGQFAACAGPVRAGLFRDTDLRVGMGAEGIPLLHEDGRRQMLQAGTGFGSILRAEGTDRLELHFFDEGRFEFAAILSIGCDGVDLGLAGDPGSRAGGKDGDGGGRKAGTGRRQSGGQFRTGQNGRRGPEFGFVFGIDSRETVEEGF